MTHADDLGKRDLREELRRQLDRFLDLCERHMTWEEMEELLSKDMTVLCRNYKRTK